MVSLARGAASSFEMLVFAERRADQRAMERIIAEKLLQQLGTDSNSASFTVELWNGENRHKVLPSYSHADENACSLNGRQDDE
jgi:hypothetical protein